jgi:acetyl-CoA carboxylase biotin carboxyl carrier protein
MSKRPQESDVDFIKALAELLRQSDLSEIEVSRDYGESDSLSVRVSRMMAPVAGPVAAPGPAMIAGPAALPPPAAAVAQMAPDPAEDPGMIASPMVGTAYLQAEPETPPFVRIGDSVTEGQTILIIEAMKTMNQIPAPRAGKVKRILIDDGAPVEFGAPLMILE